MKKSYDIIFAGTPEFSAVTLEALILSQHQIKAVYTQPDRPKGRGRQLSSSPVKELALQHQLPVLQPLTLRTPDSQETMMKWQADLLIVVAYGLILPLPILTTPKLGCINVHASLLPAWRGAAPIQRAILAGDEKTGVTIMQMDEGLDTGAMLLKRECVIEKNDTSQTLHQKLATLGANALLTALDELSMLQPQQQNNALATYAHKITKEEARIQWNKPARELARQVRAFNPWPVAFFGAETNVVRVWDACCMDATVNQPPGTILKATQDGIDVATGEGVLRLLTVQLSGGRAMPVADILNSRTAFFAINNVLD